MSAWLPLARTAVDNATLVRRLLSAFTAHPATKNETYWQHGWFAARFGCSLIRIGCAALLHAVFPFAFEYTASDRVRSMYGVLRERYHWQD